MHFFKESNRIPLAINLVLPNGKTHEHKVFYDLDTGSKHSYIQNCDDENEWELLV